MPTKKKKSKNKTGLAFAIWALGFIIILIIFLVKQDDIVSNLKTTRAFERLGLKTPEFVEKHEEKAPKANQPSDGETVITLRTQEKKPPVSRAPESAPAPAAPAPAAKEQAPAQPASPARPAEPAPTAAESAPPAVSQPEQPTSAPVKEAAKPSPAPAAEKPKPAPASATTSAKLYFVVIESDGAVSRKEITRTVAKSDSPLSASIKLLLAGPNQAERAKGCMSLIPEGTRLLSATVSGGIAMLNFSEEFEYNRVGVEGYIGQLMQIVYTATTFSTVSGVQILIDGQKKEYLGSEGVWIGSPLSRSSF